MFHNGRRTIVWDLLSSDGEVIVVRRAMPSDWLCNVQNFAGIQINVVSQRRLTNNLTNRRLEKRCKKKLLSSWRDDDFSFSPWNLRPAERQVTAGY